MTGIIGAIAGLASGEMENKRLMLFFIAGNFIYIGASDLLPEIMKETNTKRSICQMIAMLGGFAVMYGITVLEWIIYINIG